MFQRLIDWIAWHLPARIAYSAAQRFWFYSLGIVTFEQGQTYLEVLRAGSSHRKEYEEHVKPGHKPE